MILILIFIKIYLVCCQKKLDKNGIAILLENKKYSPPEKLLGLDFEKKYPMLNLDLSLPCGHPDFYFVKLNVK